MESTEKCRREAYSAASRKIKDNIRVPIMIKATFSHFFYW